MSFIDTLKTGLVDVINLGSESYETKVNRATLKACLVALFVLFVAFVLWRKIK